MLIPNYLKKIDKYFLLNYPRIWISKIHYIIFYSILANIALNICVLLYPIKPHHISYLFSTSMILILIEIIFLIRWFYIQTLYNVEKNYGKTSLITGFSEFLIYFFCVFLICSISISFLLTMKMKFSDSMNINQLISDANTLYSEYNRISFSIKDVDSSHCYKVVEKYTGITIYNQDVFRDCIWSARRNCKAILDLIDSDRAYGYDIDTLRIWHVILFNICIILFAFKHNYWIDFVFSLLYIFVIFLAILLIFVMLDSFLNIKYENEDEVITLIAVPFYSFLLFQSVRVVRSRQYSRFIAINVVVLCFSTPFIVFISCLNYFGDRYYYYFLYVMLSTFSCFPFIGLIKYIFVKLQSLPKP